MLCNDINSIMAKFWWGNKENNKKVAWMSWERMGKANEVGGLGFRDFECFNTALLAKQGWCLIHNPESLVARILKEKYHPNGTFLESPLSKRPSYVWRSIWNAKSLLNERLVWGVGNGRNIKIWGDKWLPSPMTYAIQTPVHRLGLEARVRDLIDPNVQWWNIQLIREVFMQEEAKVICSMVICPRSKTELYGWATKKVISRSVVHIT